MKYAMIFETQPVGATRNPEILKSAIEKRIPGAAVEMVHSQESPDLPPRVCHLEVTFPNDVAQHSIETAFDELRKSLRVSFFTKLLETTKGSK